MNDEVGAPRIGQWYTRWDKGEIFQVIGFDRDAKTVEVQTFDGDLDELDEETWSSLPLAYAEPPEDWTGPVDDVEHDDLGYTETDMRGEDWREPLEPYRELETESPEERAAEQAEEDSEI